jgi:hypothetical protein
LTSWNIISNIFFERLQMETIESESLFDEFLEKINIIDRSILNVTKLPEKIYHYTNLNSLQSILVEKSLWATNCMFLNDKKEVLHLKPILHRVLNEFYRDEKDFAHWFFNYYNEVSNELLKFIFVISLSNKPDSLTLWSNYTNNDGYCLVFKDMLFTQKNLTINNKHVRNMVMGRNVLYDDRLKEELFKKFVEILIDYYKRHDAGLISDADFEQVKQFAMFYLLTFALLSKDKKYEDEHEFRLITPMLTKNINEIEFRVSHDLIIPYIKLSFPIKYIEEIMIGPKRKMRITKDSIRYFLDAKGYNDIKITKSSIPLRY